MVSSVFVIGNWKMNGSTALANEFSQGIDELGSSVAAQIEVALCVPATLLRAFDSPKIRVGAQNISEHDSGAYTGELSADLLKEQSCDLVIVGHSERRHLFGESSEDVARKAAKALANGFTPIVCVGETEADREQGKTFDVVGSQLAAIQNELSAEVLEKIYIAYEPVWAIGTGKTASPEQAQEVHAWIREQLGKAGAEIPLLYGGSVKASNAEQLFQQRDIDGGLIGGASLELNEFINICRAAETVIQNRV